MRIRSSCFLYFYFRCWMKRHSSPRFPSRRRCLITADGFYKSRSPIRGKRSCTFKWKENHVLPALGLESTDPRDGILIHPCHDDAYHYLSSIGCINPASGLTTAESGVDLQDSLDRTLAIIGAIQKAYNTLPREGTIPNAVIIIEGEPA